MRTEYTLEKNPINVLARQFITSKEGDFGDSEHLMARALGGGTVSNCAGARGASPRPGPATAPKTGNGIRRQAEQAKEALLTKRIGYSVFCQTAFSEKGEKEKELNSKYLRQHTSNLFCQLYPSLYEIELNFFFFLK